MNFDALDWLYYGAVRPFAGITRACGLDWLDLRSRQTSLWRPYTRRWGEPHRRRAQRVLGELGEGRTILGISAYYHDSAAALLVNGQVVAAAQEERFSRRKHDADFPSHAVNYCLHEAGVRLSDVHLVVFYEDPWLKFRRLLKTFAAFAPEGRELFRAALPVWSTRKLFHARMISDALVAATGEAFDARRLTFAEHHLSHAASAYFPSPFDDAAVLTIDGVGEEATTTIGVGEGNHLSVLKEVRFPHSLGLLYSAFTAYTGFRVNSGEYKLMGLAPYGTPRYAPLIREHLIDLKPDGSFQLNMDYFEYGRGLRTIGPTFEKLMGAPARSPEGLLEQRHMDVAASIQFVLQEAVFGLARHAKTITGKSNLCLAGGVALNCVANGHLLRSRMFERIWIQPAAGDAGGALGAAYIGDVLYGSRPRQVADGGDRMRGAFLGPTYRLEDIRRDLKEAGAVFEEFSNEDELLDLVSLALAEGKAVGWFSGRMEFGPRALGARSIIADARSPAMQRDLNLKIKNRESFRPFAPAVLQEDRRQWFELDEESPYMLVVAQVHAGQHRPSTELEASLFGIDKLNVVRSAIPAVTHVDNSARVQTIHAQTNPRFHRLISRFKSRTGVGVIVNTSFNVRGEPIVCTPSDAFRCLMGTALDLLVVEDIMVRKEQQNPALLRSYFHELPPD